MGILIKSPFHSNNMETNPALYGLRPTIIYDTVGELFNDKNILITGTRGIGKSSLSYQLQRILNGDKEILIRCGLDVDLPKYITVDYVCSSEDSLESVVLNLIGQLEKKLDDFEQKFKIKVSKFDVNFFGAVKGEFKIDEHREENPKTVIDLFVKVIEKFSEVYVEPHINIVIDELDQIPERYNFAHFIKVVDECLDRKQIHSLSFILVGQIELFKRLREQQPAFYRLVKHFCLQPLTPENSEYVLDACLDKTSNESGIRTTIEDEAKNLLLGLSGGYPHSIHLIGHEAFCSMQERYEKKPDVLCVVHRDVLQGLKKALIREAERYKEMFQQLNQEEQQCLVIMAGCKKDIPMMFTMQDIEEGIPIEDIDKKKLLIKNSLKSLCEKQILHEVGYDVIVKNADEKKYEFCEEIFRVYLADVMQNDKELDEDF